MKITLEIPVDDAPFILSGSLKGWLRSWVNEGNPSTPTLREQDALIKLMDTAVQELEVQSMLELTELVKS